MTGSELNARAVRAGLIGAVALIYLALAGMIQKFDSRNLIGSFLTLGNLLMALPPLLTGYLAIRPRLVGGRREAAAPRAALAAGLVSGALVGGVTAAGVALVEALPEGAVRRIFIQVSPELLSILTFGRGVPLGLVLLVLYGAVLGLLGAGFRLLPGRYAASLGRRAGHDPDLRPAPADLPPAAVRARAGHPMAVQPDPAGADRPGGAGHLRHLGRAGRAVEDQGSGGARAGGAPAAESPQAAQPHQPAAAGRRPRPAAPADRLDPLPGARHRRRLPAHGAGPEHRGRLRGPARPRLRRLLRRRRLHDGPAHRRQPGDVHRRPGRPRVRAAPQLLRWPCRS